MDGGTTSEAASRKLRLPKAVATRKVAAFRAWKARHPTNASVRAAAVHAATLPHALAHRTRPSLVSAAPASEMAVGVKQPAAARPTTASAVSKPTPAVVSAKKRKGRRYAKKKPKVPAAQPAAVTATNIKPATAQRPAAARPAAKDAPSDTWRRIVIDPDLVSMREVETEGEGSGLIALEEISGRAFKGRVQVFTAEDVRAAAADDERQGAQRGGGRRQKRKRGELVPRLDVMDEEKEELTAEES